MSMTHGVEGQERLGFVLLLIIYAIAMNRLDRRYLELKDREDTV